MIEIHIQLNKLDLSLYLTIAHVDAASELLCTILYSIHICYIRSLLDIDMELVTGNCVLSDGHISTWLPDNLTLRLCSMPQLFSS